MHVPSSRTSARRARAAASRMTRLARTGPTRAALAAGSATALAAAPIALAAAGHDGSARTRLARASGVQAAGGYPVRGAIHNPPRSAYFRTTGIFSRNGGWTNRVENYGSGGAALDACHAPSGGVGCLDAFNLAGGLAFVFNGSGPKGGEILLRDPNAAPFTTNAHGIASGLNANYLEGKRASDFQLASQPAANANELGGQPPSAYATTGQLLFANVVAGPSIAGGRGATAASQSGTDYTVVFGSTDVSHCSYTASPTGSALSSGQLGVQSDSANKSAVVVSAPAGFSGGFDLQVVC